MKKGIFIKIIFIILIWEVLNTMLSIAYYQTGFETGYISLLLLFLMFYYWGKKNKLSLHYFKPSFNLKTRLPEVVAGYGWVLMIRALLLILFVIPFLFVDTLPTLSDTDYAPSVDFISLLISISLTGILTPIVEEFVFRGVIFDLTSAYSRKKAMLFNVLLFAVLHMNLLNIVNSLLCGIAFFELREKNNDIISCIMLHILINSLSLLSINNLSMMYMAIGALAVMYYIFHIVKWKKSPNKSENAKKNLCVKY